MASRRRNADPPAPETPEPAAAADLPLEPPATAEPLEVRDAASLNTGHRERLRQRFVAGGADAVADYELVELLLFSAIPRRDVKPLAKQLLAEFGGLGELLAADPAQLERRGGLGLAAVAALKVVQAAAQRMLRAEVMNRPVLNSWDRLLNYLSVCLKHQPAEQFRLLFLDRRNTLIADEVQQRGTVDHAPVYPREVVRRALELHASAVIMVHNHPSGDPAPSKADIDMTRQVARALAGVNVVLHDHLVMARGGHNSFKAMGLL
ncbi:MAG: DNA repair protein RadC [Rhodospirillaceae bacterium]|nr:DNA repair protein RadC [Rhodospirillaceae bacterium]